MAHPEEASHDKTGLDAETDYSSTATSSNGGTSYQGPVTNTSTPPFSNPIKWNVSASNFDHTKNWTPQVICSSTSPVYTFFNSAWVNISSATDAAEVAEGEMPLIPKPVGYFTSTMSPTTPWPPDNTLTIELDSSGGLLPKDA